MRQIIVLLAVGIVAAGAVVVAVALKPWQARQPATRPATAPATPVVALAAAEPAAKPKPQRVRPAAVAGPNGFYTGDAAALGKEIEGYLADVKQPMVENLRAVVCPHAGYRFSGATAAYSYRQFVGRAIETVMVLAPTHYSTQKGAYVSDVDAFETPLGMVSLAPAAKQLAQQPPFTSKSDYRVDRPAWARQSTRELPPFGEDNPDTWEHALEVQIPFIQKVAPRAKIVPVVMGELDAEAAASILAKYLDDKTVIVASSDLSHYMPYETAKHLDKNCVDAVVGLDLERMKSQEACGRLPIMTVMHLANQRGWAAKLLDYRNSGDTAGDKRGVVGYAAIAFYQSSGAAAAPTSAPAGPTTRPYSQRDRRFLLSLARMTLAEAVTNGKLMKIDLETVPPRLAEKKGCFVTLTKKGQLRGCIGYITPEKPLFQSVMENAVMAALNDRRFTPVTAAELNEIEVEVSVLTVPQRLAFGSPEDLLAKLRPGIDGVVLHVGKAQSTYLPQVWAQMPDKEKFMNSLAEKAGLAADAWRGKDVTVETYQDEAFKEAE